jgi:hypothetical protein
MVSSSSAMTYLMISNLVSWMTLLARLDAAKDIEILVLRHQLAILHDKTPRPRMPWGDRAFIAALVRRLPHHRRIGLFITPATMRWHQRLVAHHWTTHHRQPSRPTILAGLRTLTVRPATDNPIRGHRHVHGELAGTRRPGEEGGHHRGRPRICRLAGCRLGRQVRFRGVPRGRGGSDSRPERARASAAAMINHEESRSPTDEAYRTGGISSFDVPVMDVRSGSIRVVMPRTHPAATATIRSRGP